MNYRLELARNLAEEICANVADVCDRIEIGGSIRREKEFVKDIEIIAIPKWSETPTGTDLFNEETIRTNLLYERLKDDCFLRWIKPGTDEIIDWVIKPDGKYWRGILNIGLKVDLFIANELNFGSVFLVRTGSSAFSNAVYLYARSRLGFDKGQDGFLIKNSHKITTRNEQDVFNLLSMPFIPPQKRELNVGKITDYSTKTEYYDALLRALMKLIKA